MSVERALARLLTVGVALSLALTVGGTALHLAAPASPLGRRVALAGVLVLVATPVVRVVAGGVAFARAGERGLALLSLLVLALLAASVALGFAR